MQRKRIVSAVLIAIAAAALLGSGFFLGFTVGRNNPKVITVQGVTNLEANKPSSIDFGAFWQAWETISDNYLNDKNVTPQDKVYGAVKGLVGSLGDPYSEFFNPAENRKFEQDIEGNFSGIGAEIGIRKNQLVIIAPLKDTPASRAGLRAGDQILEINTSSTDRLAVDEAVSKIRGPEHSVVTLTIYRDGWDKPKDFKITREVIMVPTLDFEMKDGGIAYIALYSFNSNANRLFYNAVSGAVNKNAKGLILDLRNNPGGFLDVAVDLAGWFLPRGTLVVSEANRSGTTDQLKAMGNAALAKLPAVVLINGGSASASEILAGALRDNRHIPLVGEKSFGKGTVQQIMPLRDGSTVKLTIAHWVLPGGQILENGGLEPDYAVKITDEDIAKKADPQLDKAIEVLQSEIAHQ